jgi:hypothetical protein
MTLGDFVFDQNNWSNAIEFSRQLDGIMLQCFIALHTYQRAVNLCHADLHRDNVTLKKVEHHREFTVVLPEGTKTFRLDSDIPQVHFIDFEDSMATSHLSTLSPHLSRGENAFTVFATPQTLDHGHDNCFDIFRLLTTVANNKLKESLSPPWCAGGQLVSVELENIVRAACSPIGYQRNWHWTNFKKSVRREYIDFPIHNANLMRFPLTPEKILSDNKFIAFLTLERKEQNHRPVSYMEKVFEEKEIGFKNIEPLSWTVLQRHNNAHALEALKHFTTKVAHKVRNFDSQYSSLLDAYTIKRKAWRMTVVSQTVISLFYTYVDSLTVVAYDALTTKESYLEILFTSTSCLLFVYFYFYLRGKKTGPI